MGGGLLAHEGGGAWLGTRGQQWTFKENMFCDGGARDGRFGGYVWCLSPLPLIRLLVVRSKRV